MNIMRHILILSALALATAARAQGPLTLTLRQAMDLAAKQAYAVQASELEAEKARSKVKEITALGLPQVEASASINNYIEVPTSVVPNFFDPSAGLLEVQFGVPWSTTGGIALNQLIFDGSYLVGLEASKELRVRSEQELERTAADARYQAAKGYLGVLAAREGARLSAESVPILEKSLAEAEAMTAQGFMEATDVDRLSIALASARDRARSFAQQERVALAFLRLVLGVQEGTPLELTDRLETLLNDPAEIALAEAPLDMSGHIEHQLANTLVRLQTLDVRNQRSAYLPKLYGFFNTQAQSFGQEGPWETDWFPATLWGAQLQVPIFSSGLRSNRVKQAQLALKQTEVNRTATEQRLLAEASERSEKARTALETYNTERQNLDLARRIFDRTSIKFTNGLASSFELNQDQTQYLTAQQMYINALVNLALARTDLRKALDLY